MPNRLIFGEGPDDPSFAYSPSHRAIAEINHDRKSRRKPRSAHVSTVDHVFKRDLLPCEWDQLREYTPPCTDDERGEFLLVDEIAPPYP